MNKKETKKYIDFNLKPMKSTKAKGDFKKEVAKKMSRGEAFNKQQHDIEKARWNGKTSKHDYSK